MENGFGPILQHEPLLCPFFNESCAIFPRNIKCKSDKESKHRLLQVSELSSVSLSLCSSVFLSLSVSVFLSPCLSVCLSPRNIKCKSDKETKHRILQVSELSSNFCLSVFLSFGLSVSKVTSNANQNRIKT